MKISGRMAAALLACAALVTTTATTAQAADLNDPRLKDIAMQIVSSAENSTLDWKSQFGYIEDIGDGRGYTAGIIGFCSGTGDMLDLVELYKTRKPGNVLEKYLPALRKVNGTDSHSGLDPNYTKDWKTAAKDSAFKAAQESERDRVYFNPAVKQGKADGVRALGQFAYYDAIVMHGDGGDRLSFSSIRKRALGKAKPPSQGGDETTGLDPNYTKDWKTAAKDSVFKAAQESERDRVYFNPAVKQGKADGVRALGQFAYYDAIVVHGDGGDKTSFSNIRKRALGKAKPPSQGGDEKTWLNAFMDARVWAMKQEEAHEDVSRIETAQRVWLKAGNFDLKTPLKWKVYGDSYTIN